MVRYPFKTAYFKFMDAYHGVYSQSMWEELWRRYKRMDDRLTDLLKEGRISTMDPGRMTPEDAKEFVLSLKLAGLHPNSIGHDASALSNVCKFIAGNRCVDTARTRYPLLFRKRRHELGPIMEMPEFEKLISLSMTLTPEDDWRRIRAWGTTLTAIGAGLRTSEAQHILLKNLDPECRYVYLTRVKGWETYGAPRTAPIRPECRHAMMVYLEARGKQKKIAGSPYMFPSPNKIGHPMTENTMRRDLKDVCAEVGMDFDYRLCRRTYAQYLLDEGMSEGYAATCMGHASVKTLEANYAKPRPDRVVRTVLNVWEKNEEMKEERSEKV